jgi:putative ABC transport system permease protein
MPLRENRVRGEFLNVEFISPIHFPLVKKRGRLMLGKSGSFNHQYMLRNLIKTAVRNLLRNKGFSVLNVLGLALGLTTCILILFYVVDEFSFDKFNIKADRIFRINTDLKYGSTFTSRAISSPVMAEIMTNNFPEVEKAIRLLPGSQFVRKGNEVIEENAVLYSDPGIFDIFTLPMIAGDPHTALLDPGTVVITESTARKYFNKVQVLGYTINVLDDHNKNSALKITGVIRDVPKQSHINFDMLLPMSVMGVSHNKAFNALFPFTTYLLLKPGSNYKNLEAKFPALIRKNLDFIDDLEQAGDFYKMNLTPLTDIHLRSDRTNELGINGNIQDVQFFFAVALIILLLACINFMNLSTARSYSRAREVGVRKVLGSPFIYLLAQFLSESILLTMASTILAVLSAWALLPSFAELSGKNFVITTSMLAWLFPALMIVVLLVGLLAGIYPAFFLSSFKALHVLKAKSSPGSKRRSLRSFLVVFQLSISIFLIVGTLVVYSQLSYIRHKDLGFNRREVLVIKNMNALDDQTARLFKQEIKQMTGVKDASLSSFLPTGTRRWRNFVSTEKNMFQAEFWPVDEDYLPTMEMQIVKGRNFSKVLLTDSLAIIINEAAERELGYSDDQPLTKKIRFSGPQVFNIIGVVKNFHFSSFREQVAPAVMMLMTPSMRKLEGDGPDGLSIRVNAGNLPPLLSSIRNRWKVLSQQKPFEYSFMDQDFEASYRGQERMGELFIIFSGLAIVIACLGLFGLSAYAAEQRAREISIRKVLGADVKTLVAMLSKEFIKLVMISLLISIPLSYLASKAWLEDFAYRISIHAWFFAFAGITALLITLMTVSFQAIKASLADPVKTLRTE